ncbi:MAG: CPBP family intramembrane metalloprotease [Clostridium butyricum]|nr:CPBP family intramembrane metalloprotease [Clostridium butyricum]
MQRLRKIIENTCESKVLQIIISIIFMIPLLATVGQYLDSKFIFEKSPISLLYWPGYKEGVRFYIRIWVIFGGMAISYLYGIYYMCRRKIFVKVVLISIGGLFLSQGLGNIVNYFIGIRELQNVNSMELNGLVNRMILAQWYNPLWEEIFFTGVPLTLYVLFFKEKSKRIKLIGKIIYFIIPSIICSVYHIPNHGAARIIDTFLIHVIFQYIALKYSFWANLVMHYISDAMIVTSIYRLKNVSYGEIKVAFR